MEGFSNGYMGLSMGYLELYRGYTALSKGDAKNGGSNGTLTIRNPVAKVTKPSEVKLGPNF